MNDPSQAGPNREASLSSREAAGDIYAPPGPGWRAAVMASMLALLTAIQFWPATRLEFVNLDDPEYYTANPMVQPGLTNVGWHWAFQAGHAGNWHPVTWLSHMLDAELFGNRPTGPHAVNVGWHSLNTALVFLLLLKLTGHRWSSLAVALLFAVHPLHVESVAWISERKDLLSAFFGLITLLAYTHYVRQIPHSALRTSHSMGSSILHPLSSPWYWLALLFFALGLMSKPMLVTWPFVLLLLDIWPLNRMSMGESRRSKAGTKTPSKAGELPSTFDLRPSTLRHLLVEKLPFAALVIGSCAITLVAQERGGAVHSLADTSLVARASNAAVSYARYLGKVFWPVDLAVPYPHPGHWPVVVTLLCLGLLAGITGAALAVRRRCPALAMGWLWFLGTLVPVIGLVQVGSQSMADRYFYLPSIGLFVALVWGIKEWVKPWEAGNWKLAGATLAGLIIAALSWQTLAQIRVWHDTESLFSHAIAVTRGNYIAHYNLGHYYQEQGRRKEALEQYQRTTELKPQYPYAWNNLGALLAEDRKFAEALPCFQTALKYKPGDGEFTTNLLRCLVLAGKEQARSGQLDEALRLLRESVALAPESFDAQNALGSALAMDGQVAAGMEHFRAALALRPDSPVAHLNLGKALTALGQPEAGEWHLRRAAELLEQTSSTNP